MSKLPKYSDRQILENALELLADGRKVTSTTLRTKLGGGSEPYLKEAIQRLRLSGQLVIEGSAPSEYDAIFDAITKLLNDSRATARSEAFDQYTKDKYRLELLLAELRKQNDNLAEQARDLEKNNQALQKQLDARTNQLSAANSRINKLEQDVAVTNESLAGTRKALEKSEAKNDNLLNAMFNTDAQHLKERKELLEQLNEITKSSQASVAVARAAESEMRHQLRSAMDDGIKHTTTIGQQREQLKQLEPGMQLLKKYKTWEKVKSLCVAGELIARKK